MLGSVLPISLINLVQNNKENKQELELFYWYKKIGSILFSTKFIFKDPPTPPRTAITEINGGDLKSDLIPAMNRFD